MKTSTNDKETSDYTGPDKNNIQQVQIWKTW